MTRINDLIDINKKKGLPRTYWFNQFIRWFTLLLGSAVIIYSIWVIFYRINAESSTFYKVIPFVIIFLALNSVLRNLLSINSIKLTDKEIIFRFLARRAVRIPWLDLVKLSLRDTRPRGINFHYRIEKGDRIFLMLLTFPRIVEIVNSIAELCPHLQYDQFMSNVIIKSKGKEEAPASRS